MSTKKTKAKARSAATAAHSAKARSAKTFGPMVRQRNVMEEATKAKELGSQYGGTGLESVGPSRARKKRALPPMRDIRQAAGCDPNNEPTSHVKDCVCDAKGIDPDCSSLTKTLESRRVIGSGRSFAVNQLRAGLEALRQGDNEEPDDFVSRVYEAGKAAVMVNQTGKLSFTDRELSTLERLPKALRAKLSVALNLPSLYDQDRRKGELSHWAEKRADKQYVICPETRPSKARRVTLEEAVSELSCSAEFLREQLDGPKVYGRQPSYREQLANGETVVVTKAGP